MHTPRHHHSFPADDGGHPETGRLDRPRPQRVGRRRAIRLRWAATGAAVAASLCGIGIAQASIVSGTPFVPITPCRLLDTRPAPDKVGTRVGALGPDETLTQQVSGQVGNCDIPLGIEAVALNVTVVDPTAASYLSIYPAGANPPLASSLNWLAGQEPTPNKVDVRVSADGAIEVRNAFGDVHVLADVVGYYSDQRLTEIEGDLDQLDLRVDNAIGQMLTAAPILAGTGGDDSEAVVAVPEVVRSVTLSAPRPGTVVVQSSLTMFEVTPLHGVVCSITTGTGVDLEAQQVGQAGTNSYYEQMSGVRTFDVGLGTHTFNLVCSHFGGGANEDSYVQDAALSALFSPALN